MTHASLSLVLFAALASSCVVPVDDHAPSDPSAHPAVAAPVADAREPAPAAAVEAPKFEHAEQAFAQVKKDLLEHYYRDGVGEEEIYRAALAGMLEHLDPAMKGWNKL